MARKKKKPKPACTFCDKERGDVDLVQGPPDIYICNECVDVCSTIFSQEQRKKKTSPIPSLTLDSLPAPKRPRP